MGWGCQEQEAGCAAAVAFCEEGGADSAASWRRPATAAALRPMLALADWQRQLPAAPQPLSLARPTHLLHRSHTSEQDAKAAGGEQPREPHQHPAQAGVAHRWGAAGSSGGGGRFEAAHSHGALWGPVSAPSLPKHGQQDEGNLTNATLLSHLLLLLSAVQAVLVLLPHFMAALSAAMEGCRRESSMVERDDNKEPAS